MVHWVYQVGDRVSACGANPLRPNWKPSEDTMCSDVLESTCVACVREALVDARGTYREATRRLGELGAAMRE